MAHLKYYCDEREQFQEEWKKTIPNRDVLVIIIKKLLRHFKLGNVMIHFTSGRNHSHAGRWNVTINTTSQMNFAVVCHELAHTYQAKHENFERGDHWHTKKHRKIMKRMLNYCKKKDWFNKEIERRITLKPIKEEPTKEEQRTSRIKQLEERKKGFERKIRLSNNRIKKLNRQISALKRFI